MSKGEVIKVKASMSAMRKMDSDELQRYLDQTRKSAHVFKDRKKFDKKKSRREKFM